MYTLFRVGDNAGDSGHLCEILKLSKEGVIRDTHRIPKVGWHVRVGALYGRTLNPQDYWTTTPVTEILEDTSTKELRTIKFKTRSNSTYIWTKRL